MAESPKADDGRGAAVGSEGKTIPPEPKDPRLIPGGAFDAPEIGMNAVDRDDLPSYGVVDPVTVLLPRAKGATMP